MPPTLSQMIAHLRTANAIAQQSAQTGHHPFGAILVAPDQETVLLQQGNVDVVNHAESVLARSAFSQFAPDYLWECTMYSTVEPCAMCAATQYWANIGQLVYGMSEQRLLELTGSSSANPTMSIPCRYVFTHSQKAIAVWGPVPEVEADIVAVHQDFWQRSH